jgi:hypothetical protein
MFVALGVRCQNSTVGKTSGSSRPRFVACPFISSMKNPGAIGIRPLMGAMISRLTLCKRSYEPLKPIRRFVGPSPRRSVRAALPHTAPTSDIWRRTAPSDADAGSSHSESTDRPTAGTVPKSSCLADAPPNRTVPAPNHLSPKAVQTIHIAGYRMVVEVPCTTDFNHFPTSTVVWMNSSMDATMPASMACLTVFSLVRCERDGHNKHPIWEGKLMQVVVGCRAVVSLWACARDVNERGDIRNLGIDGQNSPPCHDFHSTNRCATAPSRTEGSDQIR